MKKKILTRISAHTSPKHQTTSKKYYVRQWFWDRRIPSQTDVIIWLGGRHWMNSYDWLRNNEENQMKWRFSWRSQISMEQSWGTNKAPLPGGEDSICNGSLSLGLLKEQGQHAPPTVTVLPRDSDVETSTKIMLHVRYCAKGSSCHLICNMEKQVR